MAKSFAPAPNPLRHERGLPAAASNTPATPSSLPSPSWPGERTTRWDLWNLVQMPHGGDLLIPTYSRATSETHLRQYSRPTSWSATAWCATG